MVPLALLGVWLKAERIERFYPNASLLEFLTKLSSDVAFGLFWGLFWAVLLLYVRRPRSLALTVAVAQVLSALVGIHLVTSHAYALRTGNPLSLGQIVLAFQEADALAGLVASQVDANTVGLLIAVVLWVTLAPWLLGPWVGRLLRGGTATVRLRRVGVASTLVLLLAATWTAPTASATFALAPAVQLAVSPIRQATAYPESLASQGALPDPAATRLEPREGERRRNLVIITLESQRATSAFPGDEPASHAGAG